MLTTLKKYKLINLNSLVKITLCLVIVLSCSESSNTIEVKKENTIIANREIQYLALGDSYTIGEAVAAGKSFPLQLEAQLNTQPNTNVKTTIIATTGWRTDQLLNAIDEAKIKQTFNFVTLLIGVNNQFQNTNFEQFETEFVILLEKAIELAANNKNNILVLSIPDYGFTPFGEGKGGISQGIDLYNAFAESATKAKGIDFLNITDITRRSREEPSLVASDGLHVSAKGYAEFVERIIELKFAR